MNNKYEFCEYCNKPVEKRVEDFISSKKNIKTGKPVVIKDVFDYICSDKDCDWEVLPFEEGKRISSQILKETRHDLTEDQVTSLRERLGFKNKFRSASFLCLEEKAFTRWKSDSVKRSTDLLLRLATLSQENLDFIKNLHKTDFKFNPEDYKAGESVVEQGSPTSLETGKSEASQTQYPTQADKTLDPPSRFQVCEEGRPSKLKAPSNRRK